MSMKPSIFPRLFATSALKAILLLSLFWYHQFAFGETATSDESNAEFSIFVDVDEGTDSIRVVFLNTGQNIVYAADTLSFHKPALPPHIYCKVVCLNSNGPDKPETESKWSLAPHYSSYSFHIPKTALSIEPGAFVEKSWGVSDLLGDEITCTEDVCKFMLKFRITTFLSDPPNDAVVKETPWMIYRVTQF